MSDQPTWMGTRNDDATTHIARVNQWTDSAQADVAAGAGVPHGEVAHPFAIDPPDSNPERKSYELLERAQINGVVRKVGDIVQLLDNEAGRHTRLFGQETETDDMTASQFDEIKNMLLYLLQPVHDLAAKQLAALEPVQLLPTTRSTIGTDATRDEATAAGASGQATAPVKPIVTPAPVLPATSPAAAMAQTPPAPSVTPASTAAPAAAKPEIEPSEPAREPAHEPSEPAHEPAHEPAVDPMKKSAEPFGPATTEHKV